MSQIEQETITSTREPIFEKEEIEETRTVFRDVSRVRISNDLLSSVINNPAPPCRRGCRRCFLAGTPITMEDGSIKHIEDIQLGDVIKHGGTVGATAKLLSDDIYDYKGIYVAGSHAVKEDGVWMRVEDSKIGKPLNDGNMHVVYSLGVENKLLDIEGITFTDFFEADSQEILLKLQDKFPFETWDDHVYQDIQAASKIVALNKGLTNSGFHSTLQ